MSSSISRTQKVAFGSIMMASSAMNNLFITFYLDLFINHSKLPTTQFYLGQSVYLMWNALNDPLFGFLQDSGNRSRSQALKRRFRAVRWGGIGWAAAFLFVWFAPSENVSLWSGIHFALSICLYDGFLTLVELSHSAILSEITVSDSERAEFNSYAAALAGLGSFSSFVGQMTWDRNNLFAFRVCMTLISIIAGFVFIWSSGILEQRSFIVPKTSPKDANPARDATQRVGSGEAGGGGPKISALRKYQQDESNQGVYFRTLRFLTELRDHRNFWVFVGVSCIQSFDCAFEKSSFAMMLERNTEYTLSASVRGVIISASFFLPWLITLVLTNPIKRIGIYQVLLYIFLTRAVICFFGFVHSARTDSAAPFLLLNRIFSELVCRVSPLVLSDLVDEDRFIHKRKREETRSGSVIGSQHFFTKIASSIGPMISFMVVQSTLPGPLLRLVFAAVPSVCVLIQLWLWVVAFELKGKHLAKVKTYAEMDTNSMIEKEIQGSV